MGALEVVVREPVQHAAKVLEGAHAPREKARLVLPREEPCEVTARGHAAQQEHPRLHPLAGDVDQHLKEVDLAKVTPSVDTTMACATWATRSVKSVTSQSRRG